MKTGCINMNTDYALLCLQGSTRTPKCRPLFAQLQRYWQQYTTRLQLSKLTARQLRDIGLTPEQAQAEVKRPFWK